MLVGCYIKMHAPFKCTWPFRSCSYEYAKPFSFLQTLTLNKSCEEYTVASFVRTSEDPLAAVFGTSTAMEQMTLTTVVVTYIVTRARV